MDRFSGFLATLALLGAGLVLARQAAYGVNLHWDSINYFAMGRGLLAGEGFVNYAGRPETRWPPLYPMLLAATGFGLFDPHEVAGPVNAALFGLTIFVVGQYLRGRLESRFLAGWASVAIALSLPVTHVASFALAGAPFILLITLALIQTDRFLREGRHSSLVGAAALGALAWLTRYLGVVAPVTIGLLLLAQRGVSLRKKTKSIAVLSFITAVPMCLWWLRNFLRAGEFVGTREPTDYSLGEILGATLSGVSAWAEFGLVPESATATITIGWLFALVLLTGAFLSTAGSRWNDGNGWRPFQVFGGFALAYLVVIVTATMSGYAWHGVQTRYLVPLYIPLVVATTVTLDRLLSRERKRKPPGRIGELPTIRAFRRTGRPTRGLPGAVLMAALALWSAGQVLAQGQEIERANRNGRGHYNSRLWAESETLDWVRENRPAGLVFSNAAIIVYHHNAGAATHKYLPSSRPVGRIVGEGRPGDGGDQLSRWIAEARDGTWVVWFRDAWGNYLYDYDSATMLATPGLEPVAELADGAVFRVNRGTAAFADERAAPEGRNAFPR